ncbi:GNAT family N-acetyltransferase [Albirhodobacter sp. R86504]|uniref:GNAT family N-acetyltransferase n=1 Tax=Albirhodobacter sp. R86504 TaxID=3093848 RepID=UPI00366D59AC
MTFEIERGLPAQGRASAVALYWGAFGGKLSRVLGPDPRGLKFVDRVLDVNHALSARRGDELIGVIGYRSVRGGLVYGTPDDLRAVYGRYGAFWRGLCFAWLARDIESRAFMVDGIVVRPDWRGRGVGAALVEAACIEARRRGYDFVRLDVVASNTRARALYERMGFIVTRERRSLITAITFGFRRVLVMEKSIAPSVQPPIARP